MESATLETLRKLVKEQSKTITWAGVVASGLFLAKVTGPLGDVSTYKCDPMLWRPDKEVKSTLSFTESDKDSRCVTSISPPDTTMSCKAKRAAVFGVNIGGDCTSGACKIYTPIRGCTLSYDIETSTKGNRVGGFALLDSEILSIAAKCSCGKEFYTSDSTMEGSRRLVSEFLLFVTEHLPMWLIGWNCYGFDNECMRYWCIKEARDIFWVIRTGLFGKPSYGSVINIPGVYNIDVLVYVSKSLYGLPSFKLGDVAKHMKITEKLPMPEMDGTATEAELRNYNMNDCVVALEVWKKESLESVIPSLALCMASPVYDCCRYVTGTMAPLGYSSHVMSLGKAISWGTCSVPQVYKGGYVMSPVKGMHRNVVVCDFSSMYPTIMVSCNINPHDFESTYSHHKEEIGKVEVSKHVTRVWLEGRVVEFDNRKSSVMSEFMSFLISERGKYKKTNPVYALTMKVSANSLYGCLGYEKSSVYSPSCAASITSVGRYYVKLAAEYLSGDGMSVIYGDTDSVMVSCEGTKETAVEKVKEKLSLMHEDMSSTSLSKVRMEVESYYTKGLMIDKKRYCMLKEDGSVKSVGISLARRDVSGLCKEAAKVSISAVFKDSEQDTIDDIASFITSVSQVAVRNAFTLGDVSRYRKRNGQNGYEYRHIDGSSKFVPESSAVLSSAALCDNKSVLEDVSQEIERFTIPCAIGRVSDILPRSSVSLW